jgi:hypothetical protein
MQPIDNGGEPLDQLRIAIPEFVKCLGLFFEYSEDFIRRVASIEDSGEFMIAEILTSPLGVLFQGRIEESFEIGCIGGSIWS